MVEPGESARLAFRFPYLSGRSFAGALGEPGVYRIRASYASKQSPFPANDPHTELWRGVWTGVVTSNETVVRVNTRALQEQ